MDPLIHRPPRWEPLRRDRRHTRWHRWWGRCDRHGWRPTCRWDRERWSPCGWRYRTWRWEGWKIHGLSERRGISLGQQHLSRGCPWPAPRGPRTDGPQRPLHLDQPTPPGRTGALDVHGSGGPDTTQDDEDGISLARKAQRSAQRDHPRCRLEAAHRIRPRLRSHR